MVRIRHFEERVKRSFVDGLVHGTTHLCIGQEAVSVGVVSALRETDYLSYTYRGHGVCLARGMSMAAALSEIFGRESGVSGGLGGSMHLTDPDLNLINSAGIVGGGLPLAVGAGLSAQLDGDGRVSATFFGDGATNIGAFHESLNLAAVWKLPVIFVCENNLYGEFTRIDRVSPFTELARRAETYAMRSVSIDGNDVLAVRAAAAEAADRAREGGGPSFIECRTYRFSGHSRTDPGKYRPAGELDEWLKRDPIPAFEARLIGNDVLTRQEIAELHEAVAAEVAQAADVAARAAWPKPRDYSESVLADP